MSPHSGGGTVVDGPFVVHGVHPAYAAYAGRDLVARIQVDLLDAPIEDVIAVARLLGEAAEERSLIRSVG